jgi:hypothetical protein
MGVSEARNSYGSFAFPEQSGETPMSDSKSLRAPEDSSRINLHERYEVYYWTRKFGVTEIQLEAAVMVVGSSAKAVEEYLAKGKK